MSPVPFAQRRNNDREHGNAIPQVFPKVPFTDHCCQIAVCGRHDPHVNMDWLLTTDFLKPAVLQDAQQTHLGGQWQFADFVE